MRTTGSEKGYTMLETIMYIGILGTLGAILASYASEVFGRYKTGRIAQQILDLKKAIITYTAASEDYSELDMQKMQNDRAVPLDMRDLRHALGGKIEFGPVGDGSVDVNDKYLSISRLKRFIKKAALKFWRRDSFTATGRTWTL